MPWNLNPTPWTLNPNLKSKPEQLRKTAEMVATFGKGIMACDESPGTVGDGFAKVGIDNTEENRRLYRCVISLSLNSLTEA